MTRGVHQSNALCEVITMSGVVRYSLRVEDALTAMIRIGVTKFLMKQNKQVGKNFAGL